MKTFKRSKTIEEIRAACSAAGFEIDTSRYDHGSDYIRLEVEFDGISATVLFNSFNGRFFGTTATGIEFNSDSPLHDGEAWFDALLDFVYVAKAAA